VYLSHTDTVVHIYGGVAVAALCSNKTMRVLWTGLVMSWQQDMPAFVLDLLLSRIDK